MQPSNLTNAQLRVLLLGTTPSQPPPLRFTPWERSKFHPPLPPPPPLRRLCSVLAPLPRSETEWGRLGGGGFQQRHPEQSVCETRGLNHEPVWRAPNRAVDCWAPPCARSPGSNKASRSQASGIPAVGGHHPPLTPPTALRRLRSAGGERCLPLRCEDSASQEGMAHLSGSTLPGLRMLLGSSVFLMARITATA